MADVSDSSLDQYYITARWCGNIEAAHNIISAANKGNHLAEAYLSSLYFRYNACRALIINKKTGAEYANKAASWLESEARRGNQYAQYNLGMMYCKGCGVEKDNKKAIRWLKSAAKQGHAGAQIQFGECYYDGVGVKKDVNLAIKYCFLAADQQHPEGQHRVGAWHSNGAASQTGEIKLHLSALNWP